MNLINWDLSEYFAAPAQEEIVQVVQEEVRNSNTPVYLFTYFYNIKELHFAIIRAAMEVATEAAMVAVMMVDMLKKKSFKLSKKRYDNDLTWNNLFTYDSNCWSM